MEELRELVARHRFTRNCFRTNTDVREENRVKDKNGRTWLAIGPYSNTVQGDHPIVECARKQVPCNAVCLNRRRADSPTLPMGPHRDSKNLEGGSYVMFWGCSENEGALVVEDGSRYVEQNKWHFCGDLSKKLHWVEVHSEGTRYSLVAFMAKPQKKTQKKTQ